MNKSEGVIKYHLSHRYSVLSRNISLTKMNAWRTIFFKLQLIGQIPGRYDGLGFGNISQRLYSPKTDNIQFIISGTQTGKLETLSERHYCKVLNVDIKNNSIESSGSCKPSSEALTHASIYQQHPDIQSVIHIHNPEIWLNTKVLNLPYTDANIAYGTPEMAEEISRLYHSDIQKSDAVISMLGHEDGIIAYSTAIDTAACHLINIYTQALSLAK